MLESEKDYFIHNIRNVSDNELARVMESEAKTMKLHRISQPSRVSVACSTEYLRRKKSVITDLGGTNEDWEV